MYINKWIIGLIAVVLISALASAAFVAGRASSSEDGQLTTEKIASSEEEAQSTDEAVIDHDSISAHPSNIEKSDVGGLVISTCYHMDNCGASKLTSLSTIDQKAQEKLVKGLLTRGEVIDPSDDSSAVRWKENYVAYALCSTQRPRIAFEFDGKFTAEEFDLTNVPGVSFNNSQLYLGLCHGKQMAKVSNAPERYGYRVFSDGGRGQYDISEPADLFQ